jgi:hypothetical protein
VLKNVLFPQFSGVILREVFASRATGAAIETSETSARRSANRATLNLAALRSFALARALLAGFHAHRAMGSNLTRERFI